eukprot:COSAG01_NODE_271_length_19794_cov_73.630890_6_plen_86_part_00
MLLVHLCWVVSWGDGGIWRSTGLGRQRQGGGGESTAYQVAQVYIPLHVVAELVHVADLTNGTQDATANSTLAQHTQLVHIVLCGA